MAQIINISLLPVLTRLYSPSDFSMLALYIAIVSLLSTAACLRFDVTIPLPKQNATALNLVAISIIIALVICTLLALLLFIFKDEFIAATKLPALIIYLIPFGVLSSAVYSTLKYWFTRKKGFPLIARTRVVQASSGGGIQVVGGVTSAGYLLFFGQLMTSSAGILVMLTKLIRAEKKQFSKIKLTTIKLLVKKYEHYPKYSTLDVLANNAGVHLPVILIATFAVGGEAGYLMLAMKVMQMPMTLIGSSIGQVFFSHAPLKNANNELGQLTSNTLEGLLKVGVGPIFFIGIIAPEVFHIVFGQSWVRAGELVSWMTLWFVLQFLSSPISMIMHVKNKQKQMLALTVTGFCIRMSAIIFAYFFVQDFIVEAYALSGAVFYLLCLWVFSFYGLSSLKVWFTLIKSSLAVIAGWLLFSLLIKMGLHFIL
ncbi:MAG: oligosaccharide flippase family protein [Colwellia sp.]|nr:oligosaccharide flippase family protein [Colwellia sp.]